MQYYVLKIKNVIIICSGMFMKTLHTALNMCSGAKHFHLSLGFSFILGELYI